MTTRSSSLVLCALAFSLAASPILSHGQATTATPTDTNAATTTAPEPAAAPAAAPAPAPAAAPAPATETPAAAPAAGERPSTYTIAQGDSLWTIAHKFGTTVVKLRKANHLKKGALLHPGQVLQIPPATTDAAK